MLRASWFETRRGVYHRAALRADPLAALLTMRLAGARTASSKQTTSQFCIGRPKAIAPSFLSKWKVVPAQAEVRARF